MSSTHAGHIDLTPEQSASLAAIKQATPLAVALEKAHQTRDLRFIGAAHILVSVYRLHDLSRVLPDPISEVIEDIIHNFSSGLAALLPAEANEAVKQNTGLFPQISDLYQESEQIVQDAIHSILSPRDPTKAN